MRFLEMASCVIQMIYLCAWLFRKVFLKDKKVKV